MSHIRDLWHDKNRKRTNRYGTGRRWQAVWVDTGHKYTKTIKNKDAAEAHLTRIDHEQRAGDLCQRARERYHIRLLGIVRAAESGILPVHPAHV